MLNHEADPETVNPNPQSRRVRCRHILTDGHRCGSPALRHEQFCYFHHSTRRPVLKRVNRFVERSVFNMPNPDDRPSILTAVGQIMQNFVGGHIDHKSATLLLYSLQVAISALPREPRLAPNHAPVEAPVESLDYDETNGFIAAAEPSGPATEPEIRAEAALENKRPAQDFPPVEQQITQLVMPTKQKRKNKPKRLRTPRLSDYRELGRREAKVMKPQPKRAEPAGQDGIVDNLQAFAQPQIRMPQISTLRCGFLRAGRHDFGCG